MFTIWVPKAVENKRLTKIITIFQFTLMFLLLSPVFSFAQNDNIDSSHYSRAKLQANKNTVTIVSGGTSTAQIRFATDLADILNKKTQQNQLLRVLPILGSGGSQNALDILYLKGVDMAIIQTDTLAYLKGQDPVTHKNIEKRINYITKLYNSEWHIIARKNINKLSDLEGKTINISKKNSGTYIASKTILGLLNINPKYHEEDDNVALQKLIKGEIDAVAMLAGVPVTNIQNIPEGSGLHFVPVDFFYQEYYKVPFKVVLEHFYLPTNLKHSDYPNLVPKGQQVPTVASSTILAVYNWPKDTTRYRKVSKFIKQFFAKFQHFKQPGRHPKWREVNLSAKIPLWNKFSAVSAELNETTKLNPSRQNNLNGVQKEMFNNFMNFVARHRFGVNNYQELSKRDQDDIYKEFLRITRKSNVKN